MVWILIQQIKLRNGKRGEKHQIISFQVEYIQDIKSPFFFLGFLSIYPSTVIEGKKEICMLDRRIKGKKEMERWVLKLLSFCLLLFWRYKSDEIDFYC
jgi:hypothetical protein